MWIRRADDRENNEDNELNRVLDQIVQRHDQMIQTARDKGIMSKAANNLEIFWMVLGVLLI